ATYSTSFKVPTLMQTRPDNWFSSLSNVQDPNVSGGLTRTVSRFGAEPELEPETSTAWTAGLDWRPESLSGFSAHLTWFDIRYENRILSVTPPSTLVALYDPAYAPIRVRRGDIPDAQFDALV